MRSIYLTCLFLLTLYLFSCSKSDDLVIDDYSTVKFNQVSIIDSLFRDSIKLSFFNSSGVVYLEALLKGVSTTERDGRMIIGGQFNATNLKGNFQTSSFNFYYTPKAYHQYPHSFNWWEDTIGDDYYTDYRFNNIFSEFSNLQFHISENYQLDSVTINVVANSRLDSLYGSPSFIRFYQKK